jgi:hypothetical protein
MTVTPYGLDVMLPDPCRGCADHRAIVVPGKGPHLAAYVCACCDQHRGWMSSTTYEFLVTLIQEFGRPGEPVVVSRKSQQCRDSGAAPVQSQLQQQLPLKG